MPKILHGFERSPPFRAVLITARAIGVKLEIHEMDLMDKKEHRLEPYLKLNPAHTIPTLDDDGFYLWESRAIMAYLVSKYAKDDKLYPKDLQQRAVVDQILHFDNGSIWADIRRLAFPQFLKGEGPNPENEEALRDRLKSLERILSQSPYVAGDHLTIADISVVGSVGSLPIFRFPLDAYPNINNLIAKVKTELPFYEEIDKFGREDLINFVELTFKK